MPTMTTRSLGGCDGAKKRKKTLSSHRSAAASGDGGVVNPIARALEAASTSAAFTIAATTLHARAGRPIPIPIGTLRCAGNDLSKIRPLVIQLTERGAASS